MKEINFKDTRGSSLFKIKDGSSIMLQALDNKPVSITCRYIDERSFYLKNARFSFKEFAELVEQNSCIFILNMELQKHMKFIKFIQIKNMIINLCTTLLQNINFMLSTIQRFIWA